MARQTELTAVRWELWMAEAGDTWPARFAGIINERRLDQYEALCAQCAWEHRAASKRAASSALVRHRRKDHARAVA